MKQLLQTAKTWFGLYNMTLTVDTKAVLEKAAVVKAQNEVGCRM